MFRFETLEIWKKAINFADQIYIITNEFPRHEIFTLTNQIRRAAISISANIAEGSASNSSRDFKVFLNYSIRSTAEALSELFVAKHRGYIKNNQFIDLYSKCEELIRKITCFKNSIK